MKTNQINRQTHDRPRQIVNTEKRYNTMKNGASTINKLIEKQAKIVARTSKNNSKTDEKTRVPRQEKDRQANNIDQHRKKEANPWTNP